MAFTRDVNLNFNSATKVINGAPQEFKEDVACDKDLAVAGNLGVTGIFTFAGAAPVWLAHPIVVLDTAELQGPVTVTGAGALGDLTMDHGDLTLTNGDIVLTNGAITAAVGNISATLGDVLVPAGSVTVGTGNVAIAVAGSFSTLLGDITTTEGDITAADPSGIGTTGNIVAAHNLVATTGSVFAGEATELAAVAAAVAPVGAGAGTLTNDTGELIWRVGAVEQSVTRTGMSTLFGDINTTDATANVVLTGATYTVAENHLVTIEAIVHGVIVDTVLADKCVSGKVQVLVARKAAGAAAIIDAVVYTEIANDTTDAAIVASATLAGNVIQITMTGKAATIISWHGLANVVDTVW